MTFQATNFSGFIAKDSEVQARLFSQYQGNRDDFDIIVIGSGMGGGILADDIADRVGEQKRILVLEAGSYLFPTHVYNVSRFDNAGIARSFACGNFYQNGGLSDEYYIHEQPQLNMGGRSIFWSGLIPQVQDWELDFFPPAVKAALSAQALDNAGKKMNQSKSLGRFAEQLVQHLSGTSLGADFHIQETPRALHQPFLDDAAQPGDQFFDEPTGVFNTSELLINQMGRNRNHDGNGLHMQIHQYVEDIQRLPSGWFRLVSRTTTTGEPRFYYAPKVVLAAGSLESPKLLMRSSIGQSLPHEVLSRVGHGLTDHPTTDGRVAAVSHCGPLAIAKSDHAKIIMYSKGHRENGQIRFPFNVEININHEYWHHRDNDPDTGGIHLAGGDSVMDFKFSFANCLDANNVIHPTAPFQYVPQIDFKNLNWTSHITQRLNRLAGWNKSADEIFAVLNGVGDRLLQEFQYHGNAVQASPPLGQNGLGFGRGTVHHAVGTMRMPYIPHLDAPVDQDSVVDEDLEVHNAPGLFVCDMSVMPLSSAANPVRTLAALALRLSNHLYP